MRTLIISDLHLGNGGEYDVFAGEAELPVFLDDFAKTPGRVYVNGDGIDFLMNEDPLELDVAVAVRQAQAIASARASATVLQAFGRVLARGGEVILRLGNHDVELAIPDVQAVIRGALGQPPAIAARLQFRLGEEPEILDVGGAKILVTHGEQNDDWNKIGAVEYGKLKASAKDYRFAPGSQLVKKFLNPLTREHKLRFANLIKPDFQGGLMTATAVAPQAIKLLFQSASASILWQLFRSSRATVSFDDKSAEQDLGLADRVDAAGLTEDEAAALQATLGDGPMAFDADDGPLSAAKVKLARAGLVLYSSLQKLATGTAGEEYFSLAPAKDEWTEAKRLAAKYHAGAVILGHTHAARWKQDEGVVYANTGTWIWLMQLPSPDADDSTWADYLAELKANPTMDEKKQKNAKLLGRFTAVTAEPIVGGGAELALVQFSSKAGTSVLGSTRIAAAP